MIENPPDVISVDSEWWQAAKNLLDAAHTFWSQSYASGSHGAVHWLSGDDGSLVIFTRGEYRDQLLYNIWELAEKERVHLFATEMLPDGDGAVK